MCSFPPDSSRWASTAASEGSHDVAYPSLATLPTEPAPDSAGDEPIKAREHLTDSSAVAVVGRPATKDEVEF
jgi:hypothetical protein